MNVTIGQHVGEDVFLFAWLASGAIAASVAHRRAPPVYSGPPPRESYLGRGWFRRFGENSDMVYCLANLLWLATTLFLVHFQSAKVGLNPDWEPQMVGTDHWAIICGPSNGMGEANE